MKAIYWLYLVVRTFYGRPEAIQEESEEMKSETSFARSKSNSKPPSRQKLETKTLDIEMKKPGESNESQGSVDEAQIEGNEDADVFMSIL